MPALNMASLYMFASNGLLSALSISNLGLISSMVGFLHDQKDNVGSYKVNWPEPAQLHVLPKHLWVDQGHTSNGVAGYGFFLGLFGLYVAWRQRRRQNSNPSKSLLALTVLQLLAVLFTLSAFIFVFVVTYQTTNQGINPSEVRPNLAYSVDKWTPETWFKAVLDLPLARDDQRHHISKNVRNMVAWRWMLIPILLTDAVAFGVSVREMLRQRRGVSGPDFDGAKERFRDAT